MSDRQPYVGPRPLIEADGIYGRDWERDELHDLLMARGVVLMHSPSGAGKTSLVQAGLVPLLRTRGIDVLGPVRPGLPVSATVPSTVHTRYHASLLTQLDDALPKDRRLSPAELALSTMQSYLGRRLQAAEGRQYLLILDQFEEVLTLDPTDLDAKRLFFQQLGDALRESEMRALFVMREDYVGSLEPYLRYIPTRLASRFRLDLLTKRPALEAITKPLEATDVTFTDEAARHIWQSLSETLVPQANGSVAPVEGPYAEAVQLQVVCKQLWNAPREQPHAITKADVERFGRIDDVLGRFFAEAVEAAAKSSGVPEARIREWCGTRLISQGLRTQVRERSDAMESMPDSAVRELINAHVLREEPRRGIRWLELTHDSLIKPIQQNNRAWFEARRTTLSEQAARWEQSGQSPDFLLSLEALARARPESRLEEEFVRASRTVRHSERRTNLAITGWAVVFAHDADPRVMEALEPLLARRRNEARERYKIYSGKTGYRQGDTAEMFLQRQGATPGVADYGVVPYYLLLIGDPETIPFEFQYALAMHYAVGRLDFDEVEHYSTYSRSVVFCESGEWFLAKRLMVFATSHDTDAATQMASRFVAYPMVERFRQSHPDWSIQANIAEDATKARLAAAMSGMDAPAVLCSFTHGLSFPSDNQALRSGTGALVCQDWTGVGGRLTEAEYFQASDVTDEARIIGMIACLSATSTAGLPTQDEFSVRGPQRPLADPPFVSALPKRLLSHPKGAALAVIGHVDRNWGYSLWWGHIGRSTGLFESVMAQLMSGHTVGSAMTALSQRASFLYSALAEAYRTNTNTETDRRFQALLISALDARNYILLGDPAARLPQSSPTPPRERPALPATVSPAPGQARPIAETIDVFFYEVDGRYATRPSLTAREIASLLRGTPLDAQRLEWLREQYFSA